MSPEAPNFSLLISQQEILDKIAVVAKQIDKDYAGKDLLLIMIMKGAICFVADLIRAMGTTFSLDFLYCSSYSGSQQKELKIYGLDDVNVHQKHVLIVDDIFDTGNTICEVVRRIGDKQPASVRSIVLLSRQRQRSNSYVPDYSLFNIDSDAFVVGYGLDYHERHRGLPGIFSVKI